MTRESWITDVNNKEPIRVGVILATFDPLTKDYESIVDGLLEKSFDHIVLIPADLTPLKPARTETPLRHQMLQLRYCQNDRVWIPEVYNFGFPQSRGIVRFLESSGGCEVVPIIQAEDIKSTIKAKMLRYLLPSEKPHYLLNDGVIQVRSFDVKRKVRNNDSDVTELLSPLILTMIRQNHLYTSGSKGLWGIMAPLWLQPMDFFYSIRGGVFSGASSEA
ncbi:MAG: hypothetical protein H6618_06250 [Deltaproteobacteria bacterium]|nr:hypothetical protein [Deltaproteobacteria bacterium]